MPPKKPRPDASAGTAVVQGSVVVGKPRPAGPAAASTTVKPVAGRYAIR